MKNLKLVLPVLVLVLSVSLSGPLAAQDAEKNFTGTFSFGYRAVDQDGAANKYREHLNLDKGMRLFNFSFSYTAPEALKKIFDRVDFNAMNLGGDPYESLNLSVRKYGLYKFEFHHRKSTYFYGDMNERSNGKLFDPVRFNFDRMTDGGSFDLTLAKYADVFLNFERTTKTGDSQSSFDVNNTVIDADEPVSEKLTQFGFGLNLHTDGYGLVFEQKRQNYANDNSLFLTGPSTYTADISSFKLSAQPFDSLIIRGSALMSTLDSSVRLMSETDASAVEIGSGTFNRKIEMYDADLTWYLFRKLAVVGAVRYGTFDQSGRLTAEGETEMPKFGFETLAFEGGLQYQLNPKFSLTGGYRHEERTLDGATPDLESPTGIEGFETVNHTDTTVRDGFFGNLRWDIKNLKWTADFQHGDYEDPFTMISPTMFDRFRTTLRWQMKAFSLSAGYLMARTKNEIPGGVNFRIVYTDDDYTDLWQASNDQFNVRLGYAGTTWHASLGYSSIKFKTDSERLIAYNPGWLGAGGEFPWSIHYTGESTLLDAMVGLTVAKDWRFGAYLNSYKNSGSWPIERTMLRLNAEYTFLGGFVSQLAYRYYDFKETGTGLVLKNNYTAGIWELSFGYRWQ